MFDSEEYACGVIQEVTTFLESAPKLQIPCTLHPASIEYGQALATLKVLAGNFPTHPVREIPVWKWATIFAAVQRVVGGVGKDAFYASWSCEDAHLYEVDVTMDVARVKVRVHTVKFRVSVPGGPLFEGPYEGAFWEDKLVLGGSEMREELAKNVKPGTRVAYVEFTDRDVPFDVIVEQSYPSEKRDIEAPATTSRRPSEVQAPIAQATGGLFFKVFVALFYAFVVRVFSQTSNEDFQKVFISARDFAVSEYQEFDAQRVAQDFLRPQNLLEFSAWFFAFSAFAAWTYLRPWLRVIWWSITARGETPATLEQSETGQDPQVLALQGIYDLVAQMQTDIRELAGRSRGVTEEMAQPGSTRAIETSSMIKSTGRLYRKLPDGSEEFVGLCGRAGNQVVTALHNFRKDAELILRPCYKPNANRQAVLRLSEGNMVYASQKGLLSKPDEFPLDMIVFKVEPTWPVLASVPPSVPMKGSSVKTVVYDVQEDMLRAYDGPISGLTGTLLLHKSATDYGSSGSLMYQAAGNRIYAVGLHVGAHKPSSYNIGHLLTPIFVYDEESNFETYSMTGSAYDTRMEKVRKSVTDIMPKVRGVSSRQITMYLESLPPVSGTPWWTLDDESDAEGDYVLEDISLRARPLASLDKRMLFDACGDRYVKYLASADFELSPTGSDPIGAFGVQQVGKLRCSSEFGNPRAMCVEIPVNDEVNSIVEYAGKYVMPPKDGAAQRAALRASASVKEACTTTLVRNQLSKAFGRVFRECKAVLGDKDVRPSELVTRAIGKGRFEVTPEEAKEAVRGITFKLEAKPGVLLQSLGFSTKRNVLETNPQLLVELALGRIARLAAGHIDRDPVKIFIKDEFHSLKKRCEQRWRIISVVSMVDEMVEKLLMGRLHEVLIAENQRLPVCPGMGNLAEEVPSFHNYLGTADEWVISSDVSAFDWHVEAPWLLTEARMKGALITGATSFATHAEVHVANDPTLLGACRASFAPTSDVAEVLYRHTLAIISTPFVDADGFVHGQRVAGIQRSGRYNTAQGNSVIRTAMQYYVMPNTVRVKSMGDDQAASVKPESTSVEELVGKYREIGLKLTDVHVADFARDKIAEIEFCSHKYILYPNGRTGLEPVNVAKSVAKFMHFAPHLSAEIRVHSAVDVASYARKPQLAHALLRAVAAIPARNNADEDGEVDDYVEQSYASRDKAPQVMAKKSKSKQVQPKKQQVAPPKKNGASKQPMQRVSVPAASGTILRPSAYQMQSVGPSRLRVRGHEMLGSVVGSAVDKLIGVYDSNPACWTSSRLSLIARGYERYRYHSARIIYVPSVGSNQSGMLGFAVETDPDEKLPADAAAMQRLLNMQHSCVTPVWQSAAITFKRDSQDLDWYKASILGESTRSAVSQFLVACVSDISASGVTFGRLVIEYDLEFMYPELEYSDGGWQYVGPSGAPHLYIGAGAAGADATVVDTGNSGLLGGPRVIEWCPASSLSGLVTLNSDTYTIAAGARLFLSYVGGVFKIFATFEGAKAGVTALKLVSASAAGQYLLSGFWRPLINVLDSR